MLNKDQIAERGARMARRDDREYREYLREEQRRQPGCPAREVVLDQRGRATSGASEKAAAPNASPCFDEGSASLQPSVIDSNDPNTRIPSLGSIPFSATVRSGNTQKHFQRSEIDGIDWGCRVLRLVRRLLSFSIALTR